MLLMDMFETFSSLRSLGILLKDYFVCHHHSSLFDLDVHQAQ
jgi:hypothetical protein